MGDRSTKKRLVLAIHRALIRLGPLPGRDGSGADGESDRTEDERGDGGRTG